MSLGGPRRPGMVAGVTERSQPPGYVAKFTLARPPVITAAIVTSSHDAGTQRRLLPCRGAVLVALVAVTVPALAPEVPAGGRLPAGPAAHCEATHLLATARAAEVAGGVRRHRRRVTDDPQPAVVCRGQRGAGHEVGLWYPPGQARRGLVAEDRLGRPLGGLPAQVGRVVPVERRVLLLDVAREPRGPRRREDQEIAVLPAGRPHERLARLHGVDATAVGLHEAQRRRVVGRVEALRAAQQRIPL